MKNLNKIHNIILNCSTENELKQYAIFLLSEEKNHAEKTILENLIKRPILAADCSIIPIYYFEASTTTGKKQDKDKVWY